MGALGLSRDGDPAQPPRARPCSAVVTPCCPTPALGEVFLLLWEAQEEYKALLCFQEIYLDKTGVFFIYYYLLILIKAGKIEEIITEYGESTHPGLQSVISYSSSRWPQGEGSWLGISWPTAKFAHEAGTIFTQCPPHPAGSPPSNRHRLLHKHRWEGSHVGQGGFFLPPIRCDFLPGRSSPFTVIGRKYLCPTSPFPLPITCDSARDRHMEIGNTHNSFGRHPLSGGVRGDRKG